MSHSEQSLPQRAKALAERAHAGQRDKAGAPYIAHCARVASAVASDPMAEAVGWLHDVLEDCADVFCEEVYTFPHAVAHACVLLSRASAGTPEAYYAGIRSDPLALRVKLADIADNADEARLALIDAETADRLRKKYAQAMNSLGVGAS